MKNNICVYDFETDGPNSDICQPVQIAACMLDYRTLEYIDNSEFCSYMKPDGIDDVSYFTEEKVDTILWHAKNYNKEWSTFDEKQIEKAKDEIIEKWRTAPDQRVVYNEFKNYLLRYNTNQSRRTMWTAPIRAGANIKNFDNNILDRLCKKYNDIDKKRGCQKLFHPRDQIDIVEQAYYWFESLQEPSAYNMGVLREFFGLTQDGAHDALADVYDEAVMIQSFMKLHRRIAQKTNFKNALKGRSLKSI